MPSQADFARHVGITRQAVSKLVAAGILPKRGTIYRWRLAYIEHLRGRAERRQLRSQAMTGRIRTTGLRADKLEMEIAVLDGLLVPVEEVERDWTDKVAAVRSRLMALPLQAHRVMAAGSPRQAQQILGDLVAEALADLARDQAEPDYRDRKRVWRQAVRAAKRPRA